MQAVHVIKKTVRGLPPITKIPGQANTWSSGYWTMSEDTARSLIRGKIYFHERQREASYYGGEIVDIERVPDGKYQDKIVFKFVFSPEFRGVVTSQDGWAQEMKLVADAV